MRVLLNTKPLIFTNKTGVGYYVCNLYRALQENGLDVVPTLSDDAGALINALSRVSCFVRRHAGSWYSSVATKIGDPLVRRLSRKAEAKSVFDLYHETSLDPIPPESAVCVCNIYDLSFISYPQYVKGDFAGYARTSVTENSKIAKRIIVNTRFVKGEVMDILKIPEDRIDVIPLAPQSIQLPKSPGTSGSKWSGAFNGKDYILYVGSVEPRKNLMALIRAFGITRQTYDVSLCIAGGLSHSYEEIFRCLDELGIRKDVVFTGYINEEELMDLYRNATVFVYPSLYEGFGLPPLEAMTCGVPVVISSIEPLTEVSGSAALSFSPNDYEELSDILNRVISSPSLREDMVRKGSERVKDFSWTKTAEATIKTYARALSG